MLFSHRNFLEYHVIGVFSRRDFLEYHVIRVRLPDSTRVNVGFCMSEMPGPCGICRCSLAVLQPESANPPPDPWVWHTTDMTGRHNLSVPVVTKDSQKKTVDTLLQAQWWLFVKCFQVTSGIVSVFKYYTGFMDDLVMIIVFDLQGWSKVTTHWWKSASMRQQRSSVCLRESPEKWKKNNFDANFANWILNFFKDSLYRIYRHIPPFSPVCSIFADLFGWNTGFSSGARALLHFLILLWFQ